MIIMVTVAKVIFLGFVVIVRIAIEKQISEEQYMEKLVGIGSVMENYARCDR